MATVRLSSIFKQQFSFEAYIYDKRAFVNVKGMCTTAVVPELLTVLSPTHLGRKGNDRRRMGHLPTWLGGVGSGRSWIDPPTFWGQTNTCENITFPRTSYVVGNGE